MSQFRLKVSKVHKIKTSIEFAKEVDSHIYANGTGGLMCTNTTESDIVTHGCNENDYLEDNKLFLFDVMVIDFTNEIINENFILE